VNDGSIKSVDLYCYLKARFGEPNGLSVDEHLGDNLIDNIVYWHYIFSVDNCVIHIMDKSGGLEVLIKSKESLSKGDWHSFINLIKGDFKRIGPKKSEVYNSLDKRKIFINPYKRLYRVVKRLIERLEALNLGEPPSIKDLSNEEQIYIYDEKRIYFSEAMILGASLMAIIPVWGESFINLIIFALIKKIVKYDDRILRLFIEQPIDFRTKTLHLYCDGFIEGIDAESIEYKEFKKIMDIRNDFLHGNIKPKEMQFDELIFDNEIPLFKDDRTFFNRMLEDSLYKIERENVLKKYEEMQKFIEYVLGHLDSVHKNNMEHLMESMFLSFGKDEREIKPAFPGWLGVFDMLYMGQ
jgi:hypothetical protein